MAKQGGPDVLYRLTDLGRGEGAPAIVLCADFIIPEGAIVTATPDAKWS